jgi:hypothetical protein
MTSGGLLQLPQKYNRYVSNLLGINKELVGKYKAQGKAAE